VSWPGGLYGHGMHEFVIRELEIGYRAATMEDLEWLTGLGVWVDLALESQRSSALAASPLTTNRPI
jgi:hypothetical protein